MDSPSCLALLATVLCLLARKGCQATVYCQDQNGNVQYSCEDSAYCCGHMECCLLENGVSLFELWYFWVAVGSGVLICIAVSGMFCKSSKRHRQLTRVSDVRFSAEIRQHTAEVHHQQLQQPQQQQVVVLPLLYNQPPPNVPQQGVFSISGSILPTATTGAALHPGMTQAGGQRAPLAHAAPVMNQRRPGPGARQRTDSSTGEFAQPLGPGYLQPGAYGPLPPGYVPPN